MSRPHRRRATLLAGLLLVLPALATAPAHASDLEQLPAPTGMTALHVSDTAAELNWTSTPLAREDVLERLVDESWVQYARGVRGYLALTSLTPGTRYTFRVHSVAGSGYSDSPPSQPYSFDTLSGPDADPPAKPGKPTFGEITSTLASVFWPQTTDNVEVTGYYLDQFVNGSWSTYRTVGAFGNFLYVSNLTPATTYTFGVRAFDARGNISERSDPGSFTTLANAATLTCTAHLITFNPGFMAELRVVNNTTAPITGWKMTFTLPASMSVTSAFGGTVTRSGDQGTISPPPYLTTIGPGGAAAPGFLGYGRPFAAPTNFAVNGTPCTTP